MHRALPLLLAVVAAIPLAYGLPLVTAGLFDLHAVRHLDEGSFTILSAWKDVYAHGPMYWGSFDPFHIYPKAFYNLAGLVLYPYAMLHGEDYRMTMVVWRAGNILLTAAGCLMLSVLVRRAAQSRAAAVIAAVCFALTPEVLTWAVNVRPNPLEQLATFGALAGCVALTEGFRWRRFLVAAGCGAMAFATKYGGLPFLLFIPLVCVLAVWRHPAQWEKVVAFQLRVVGRAAPLLAVLCAAAGLAGLLLFARYGYDGAHLYLRLTEHVFPPELLPKVIRRLVEHRALVTDLTWVGCLTLLAASVGLLAVAWRVRRAAPATLPRRAALPLLALLFGLEVGGMYLVFLFAMGPAYLARPAHFLSEFGFTVYYMALGGSFADMARPGFLGYLRLVAREMPGFWWFLPLFTAAMAVAIIQAVRRRRPALLLLSGYIVCAVVVLVTMADPQLRHVLPAVGVAYGLIGFFGVEVWRMRRRLPVRLACQAVIGVLLCGYLAANIRVAAAQWTERRSVDADIGFAVGAWLRDHVPTTAKILTDQWTFYLPPEYTAAQSTTFTEWKSKAPAEQERFVAELVRAWDPAVVIVTRSARNPRPVALDLIVTTDAGLLDRHYRLIQAFHSRRAADRIEYVGVYAPSVP
ncbi:MAG: hypothetical protein HY543_03000, partial [Deltaproteobacteria bacterium]|nr:hypothetical protein [Deltaproteobacteria bacterium]